jgi:hypothetical protein
MEMIAKMLLQFLQKDATMREGVSQSVDFIRRLDARLRAIEAKVGINEPPLSTDLTDELRKATNGTAHN